MNIPKNPSNRAKSFIHAILVVAVGVFIVPKLFGGDLFGNNAVDAAEKYVNQQVYYSLGITCEKYDTDVIYKKHVTHPITIQIYTEGSSIAVGSYCVYCEDGYVSNSTKMMGAEYPYEDHIDELKALFGI